MLLYFFPLVPYAVLQAKAWVFLFQNSITDLIQTLHFTLEMAPTARVPCSSPQDTAETLLHGVKPVLTMYIQPAIQSCMVKFCGHCPHSSNMTHLQAATQIQLKSRKEICFSGSSGKSGCTHFLPQVYTCRFNYNCFTLSTLSHAHSAESSHSTQKWKWVPL